MLFMERRQQTNSVMFALQKKPFAFFVQLQQQSCHFNQIILKSHLPKLIFSPSVKSKAFAILWLLTMITTWNALDLEPGYTTTSCTGSANAVMVSRHI